jgi:uncharacterized membrane protein YqgA involved in biofilm formation
MIGVVVNTVLVIIGSLLGLFFKKGIPENVKKSIMIGLGLFTCLLGIKLGLEMKNAIVVVLSIVTGGFVFASLLFCIGPMTVLGCVQAGVENNPELLFVKSLMDGVAAIILASTFGLGVIFSALTVLFFQGGLVLLAGQMDFLTTPQYLNDFTSVGGIIIFGIGIKLLGLKPIKNGNFLPALILVLLFTFIIEII